MRRLDPRIRPAHGLQAPPAPRSRPLPAPRLALVLLAASTSGCGVFGLKGIDTSVEVDTGGLTEAVSIVSIAPDRGPLETETDVTLRGTGFTGDVTLKFGNTAVDVTVLSDTELVASTPSVPVEASVDVTVTSDLGEAVLLSGFTFSNNAGGDDGGGDDDGGSGSGDDGGDDGGTGDDGGSGTDNTGKVTGYAEHNYFIIGCPSCLGYADYTSIESFAVFHPPTTGSWFDWFPRQGSCTVNPSRNHPTSTYTDVGSAALLQSGSAARTMTRAQEGALTYYTSTTLDDGSFVRNTSFDVLAPYATTPVSAPGALRTISTGFTSIEPIAIFNDSYSAFTPMSASSAYFSWAPASTADGVVIDLLIFDSLTGDFRGEVMCWANDSGGFQVPFADIAAAGTYIGDLGMVYYYKFTKSSGVDAADGGTIETASSFGGIGTITIYE